VIGGRFAGRDTQRRSTVTKGYEKKGKGTSREGLCRRVVIRLARFLAYKVVKFSLSIERKFDSFDHIDTENERHS
jgi:hypothetical protein